MPLSEKQISIIKAELQDCTNPLFFFHDDPDGLCSFLLFYRYIKEGKGIVVKSLPKLDSRFIKKAQDYDPDKIFVLDIAMVDQEFIDSVKRPVVWIDHHEPLDLDRVKIFNPRIQKKEDGVPVTYTCYQVVKQDMWIAACGCVGDWFLPDFLPEFKEQYPGLVDKESTDPGDILFETKLGKLVKIMSFILKGKTKDALNSIKVLTRIDSPYEILDQLTPRGKFIFKRFQKINNLYEDLLKRAIKKKGKSKLLLFSYDENKMSFTGDLSNELLHRFPDKLIIIAREKNGEMRMSLRSKNKVLPPLLQSSLVGLEGYGGGHEHACGACVKKNDFKEFLQRLKKDF